MSDYISISECEREFDNKLSLVIRKPQEGKTFICIANITNDKTNNIHIVMTMNTLSAGMQFFGRMEAKVGSKNIIVFNSNKKTAGECHYAKEITDIIALLKKYPDIKVLVCCAHEKRIRNSIPKLLEHASDSTAFTHSNRKFIIHIDEAHKYIPENIKYVRGFNQCSVVKSIIGYSGTPDGIWCKDDNDEMFHKILIRDIEAELQIVRAKDYFGVSCCEFIITEHISPNDIIEQVKLDIMIPQVVISRAKIPETRQTSLYGNDFHFDLGNEIQLLSYISYILPTMEIKTDCFSYHFVPAYTRKATHYYATEIILRHYPTANVIVMNGNGMELFRINPVSNKSYRVTTNDQIKKIIEPSYQIQSLIKDTRNFPTFVTGFTCVGMSVTLINEQIGNFDSLIMVHEHYSRDKLFQLCRCNFNYTSWTPENKVMIKKTKFYSLFQEVVDICIQYEKSVELMSTEFSGKTCSLREIQGLADEEPSERECKKAELNSIKSLNTKIWKKFKIYDGNDEDEWKKAEDFYEEIMKKKLKSL